MIVCETCGAPVVLKTRSEWEYQGVEEGQALPEVYRAGEGEEEHCSARLNCSANEDHACGWSIEDDAIVEAEWVRERKVRSDAGSEQVAETD